MATPHARVRAYYSGTLDRHGAGPRGVDWTSTASQYLRFVPLLRLCDFSQPFSLIDFGCGYGALLDYLAFRHPQASVSCHGVDLSPAMIEAARRRWRDRPATHFSVGSLCPCEADYALASGVFNVRLSWPRRDWEDYIENILTDLRAGTRRGFGVNFMLPHDDGHEEDALYRCTPERWVRYVAGMRCDVEVLDDYGLREFTLLARF